jgi:hypothetical protein
MAEKRYIPPPWARSVFDELGRIHPLYKWRWTECIAGTSPITWRQFNDIRTEIKRKNPAMSTWRYEFTRRGVVQSALTFLILANSLYLLVRLSHRFVLVVPVAAVASALLLIKHRLSYHLSPDQVIAEVLIDQGLCPACAYRLQVESETARCAECGGVWSTTHAPSVRGVPEPRL